MAAKKTFTFRKRKRETGLASTGKPEPDTVVKLDKMEIGYIQSPSWITKDGKWRIRFMVVDATAGCGWSWRQFKELFDDEPKAREFLQKNGPQLLKQYQFRKTEDEGD
jgi:hypothetical protein